MIFVTLKQKCEYYRSIAEQRLIPNQPVIVMVDGRGFSNLIKRRFAHPYDERFADIMNIAARTVCESVQGCRFGYVQSDEASFLIYDGHRESSFFDLRVNKLCSIIASTMSVAFARAWKEIMQADDAPFAVFDARCWNVPVDDVTSWFVYRQNDCVRNAKQGFAQHYLPHGELLNCDADAQVEKADEVAYDRNEWLYDEYPADFRYGRMILRREREVEGRNGETVVRKKFVVESAETMMDEVVGMVFNDIK